MGQYDNSLITCSFQYRLKNLTIIRDNANDINATADQILYRAYLQGGVSTGGAYHIGFYSKLFTHLFDAHFHGIEPGDAPHLGDHGNRRRLLSHCAGAADNAC